MNRRLWLTCVVCVATLAGLGGCTHVNKQLNSRKLALEARQPNRTRASIHDLWTSPRPADDGWFVGLALSGGGLRSSNFSAACMLELQRLGLLQRVDCISSVSGGSLTAAYYCVHGDAWNPHDIQKRLTHSFAGDIIAAVLQPWSLAALSFTWLDRSDVLAASFQRVLYSRNGKGLNFDALRDDRPRLLINATDLQSGRKFVFCNEEFDALNSSLAEYPIAYAVAASSAVPVLLHQVTLRDYSTEFEQYRHLIDGGINDNLGVTTLVETYTRQIAEAARLGLPDPYPRGMVLLVVDAHTNYDSDMGGKPDTGMLDSLAAGAGLSTTTLLNRVSSATLAQIIVEYAPDDASAKDLREQISALEQSGVLYTYDRQKKPVRVMHLSLTRVDDAPNQPDAGFSQRVNSIATYFNIEPNEAYHLYKAAEVLVAQQFAEPLRKLSDELKIEPTTQP